MALSKKEAQKRDSRPVKQSYIDYNLVIMHQTGIPSVFTEQYMDRLNACKNNKEVDRLLELMRHTYFERTWQP